jgi:hypothetical protein
MLNKEVNKSSGVLLSKAERKFLEDLLVGKLEGYSYEYQRMLRKRILDKQLGLTDDVHLIEKARSKLLNLPSRKKAIKK